MGLWLVVARIAAGVNVILLLGLTYVWARNYRAIGSKHALGLVIFAAFLLAENGLALYYFLWHPVMRVWFDSSAPVAQLGMMTLRVLELGALLFLAWITWD